MERSQQLERENESLREQLSGTAAKKEDTGLETSCATAAEEQEEKSGLDGYSVHCYVHDECNIIIVINNANYSSVGVYLNLNLNKCTCR